MEKEFKGKVSSQCQRLIVHKTRVFSQKNFIESHFGTNDGIKSVFNVILMVVLEIYESKYHENSYHFGEIRE